MTGNDASKAQAYLEQKAWNHKPSGTDNAAVETCPFCGNDNYKFIVNVNGGANDGLWNCKVCGEKGSLYMLRQRTGDAEAGIVSLHDSANGSTPPPLPDVRAAKWRLLNDPDFAHVLDYLVAERGFSMAVIESMGLGVDRDDSGKCWISFPYFNKVGNVTFVKYRSVPPEKKAFRATSGREAGLYNDTVITSGMDDLVFAEGEADTLSCLSNGIANVVGIPGANTQKAAWITKVDNAKPKKLYLLFDRDKAGQDAAHKMANRLGIEKAHNILLPEFTTRDGKPGKDINEWFRAGHTLDEFNTLKEQSRPFDVAGVQGVVSIIEEIQNDIETQGAQRYALDTPWTPLTEKLGGANYGEVIGIIAEGKVGKTTMCLNWLDYYSQKGIPSLFFCLEMTQKALVRKWISYRTQTDDTPTKSQFTKQTVIDGLEIAKNMQGDLLFGFCRVHKVQEVFDLIRQAVRRYGVKVVCFDNLQFLVRSIEHSAQETASISKQFKELAMELEICILLVVQPNRVREGDIVAARNAANSSAIEKDVDAMIALHRNRTAKIKADDFHGYLDAAENFEPQLLCRVDLSRYAPGGVCTLWIEGGTSTIREFREDDKSSVKQHNTNPNIEREAPAI